MPATGVSDAPVSPPAERKPRVPIVATLVVVLAAAAMVALGVWQLQRRDEKAALLRQLAANAHLPPIAFPSPPVGDMLLFRAAAAECRQPISMRAAGAGASGFRIIATCRGGMQVQLGTTQDPTFRPRWTGGVVHGFVSHAPDARPLIVAAVDHRQQALMLVAREPVPGLGGNPGPNLTDVPNNHLSYAVQWFTFAAISLIIYAIAVRRRFGGRKRGARSAGER